MADSKSRIAYRVSPHVSRFPLIALLHYHTTALFFNHKLEYQIRDDEKNHVVR